MRASFTLPLLSFSFQLSTLINRALASPISGGHLFLNENVVDTHSVFSSLLFFFHLFQLYLCSSSSYSYSSSSSSGLFCLGIVANEPGFPPRNPPVRLPEVSPSGVSSLGLVVVLSLWAIRFRRTRSRFFWSWTATRFLKEEEKRKKERWKLADVIAVLERSLALELYKIRRTLLQSEIKTCMDTQQGEANNHRLWRIFLWEEWWFDPLLCNYTASSPPQAGNGSTDSLPGMDSRLIVTSSNNKPWRSESNRIIPSSS